MIERIIASSVRNRFGVLMATVLLVVAGAVALFELPIDAMPDLTPIQVQVLTRAPALGPLEVEQLITRPVENAMSGLPRLQEIRSISRYGVSNVTIVFADGTERYLARQLVGERLPQVQEEIPPGVDRPEMGPPNSALGEVFHFLVEGEGVPLMDLRTILDWDIAYRLRSVPGVVEVNTAGGPLKQYQVMVDPVKLLAYRLSLPQIFDAIEKSNLNRGGGIIEKGGEGYVIRGEGMITGMADLEKAVIGLSRDGKPILLRQVAEVRLGPRLRIGGVTANGKGEAVMAMVMMLPGANARDVVRDVKRELQEIAPTLPKGVRVVPFYDREKLVSRVIATVRNNLLEGGLLVVAVLLVLLGHLRPGPGRVRPVRGAVRSGDVFSVRSGCLLSDMRARRPPADQDPRRLRLLYGLPVLTLGRRNGRMAQPLLVFRKAHRSAPPLHTRPRPGGLRAPKYRHSLVLCDAGANAVRHPRLDPGRIFEQVPRILLGIRQMTRFVRPQGVNESEPFHWRRMAVVRRRFRVDCVPDSFHDLALFKALRGPVGVQIRQGQLAVDDLLKRRTGVGLEPDRALHDVPQPLLEGLRAVSEGRPTIGHGLLQAGGTLRDAEEDEVEAVEEEPCRIVPDRGAPFGQRVGHRQQRVTDGQGEPTRGGVSIREVTVLVGQDRLERRHPHALQHPGAENQAAL